jgi:methionyl-tRNA synthetase
MAPAWDETQGACVRRLAGSSRLTSELRSNCLTPPHVGVPVRRRGVEGKVLYVWFEQPTMYIAAPQSLAARHVREADHTSCKTSLVPLRQVSR